MNAGITLLPAFEKREELIPLYQEYADMLVRVEPIFTRSLEQQNYDEEIARLEEKYAPPRGSIYLVYVEDELAGCVGMKPSDTESAELKRLYVRPAFRGKGHTDRAGAGLFQDQLSAALPGLAFALVVIEQGLGIPAAEAQQLRSLGLGGEQLVRADDNAPLSVGDGGREEDKLLPFIVLFQAQHPLRSGGVQREAAQLQAVPIGHGLQAARLVDRVEQGTAALQGFAPQAPAVEKQLGLVPGGVDLHHRALALAAGPVPGGVRIGEDPGGLDQLFPVVIGVLHREIRVKRENSS